MSEQANVADKFLGKKERRKSSAIKVFLGDYQKLSGNQQVRRMLEKNGDRQVMFADLVVKVNRKNKMQDRMLLVSDSAIYNLDPSSATKVKRRIQLDEVGKILMSPFSDNFFVINVPGKYDYLICSRRKVEIVTQIMQAYERLHHSKLPVVIAPSFEYRIDSHTVREIRFSKVDSGVNTQIFVHSMK